MATSASHKSSSSVSGFRPGRRVHAAVLLSLTPFAASAPAALAEPDTNIQKPGHVAVLGR